MPEQDYGYNGGYQTFIAPRDGEYQIELRGAQGGDDSMVGYKGAYTKGTLSLASGEVLYIYIGGKAVYL
jgi:hypothetical protein